MKLPKTFGDWYLILIYLFIAAMWLISCTKSGYKPDHDQVSCKIFYDIREVWGDSARYYIRTDTMPSLSGENSYLICDKETLSKLEATPPSWHKICNSNGEVTHWEYWIPELK